MKKCNKKMLAGIFAITLACASFTGCKNNSSEYSGKTITVQVQEINGSKVTAQVGSMEEVSMDDMQKNKNGKPADNGETPPSGMPQGDNGGTPPSGMPQGDNGGTPPSGMPQGDNGKTPPSGMPERPDHVSGDAASVASGDALQGRGGNGDRKMPSTFTAGDDSVSFTLSDEVTIQVESMNGETDGSKDDITEGTVLEVTYNKKGDVSSIIVKNVMGQKGGRPDQNNSDSNNNDTTNKKGNKNSSTSESTT